MENQTRTTFHKNIEMSKRLTLPENVPDANPFRNNASYMSPSSVKFVLFCSGVQRDNIVIQFTKWIFFSRNKPSFFKPTIKYGVSLIQN